MNKPKIKIESIYVESKCDESADMSTIGNYTNSADHWNIDRRSGEFCNQIYKRQRILESLYDKLETLLDLEPIPADLIQKTNLRIEKIKASGNIDFNYHNHSYRYFTPYAAGEKPGSKEYKLYAMQDYKRAEEYNNGSWCYIGIIAKAKILVNDQYQTISSGGLWGIESDSGDYLQEVAKEQIEELKEQLSALGLGKRAIEYAVKQWDGEIKS